MADIPPELAARIEELRTKHVENPAKFFMSLANAYREAGQVGEAETLLREHLKRHPGYLSAHVLLGGCLADRGARDEARNEFQYVLSIDPQNLIALRTLGDMAAAQGDREEARRWYGDWLSVDPMSGEARRAMEALDAAPAEVPEEGSWDPYAHGEVEGASEQTQPAESAAPAEFGAVEIAEGPTFDLPETPAAGPPVTEDREEAGEPPRFDLPASGAAGFDLSDPTEATGEAAAFDLPESAAADEPSAASTGGFDLSEAPESFELSQPEPRGDSADVAGAEVPEWSPADSAGLEQPAEAPAADFLAWDEAADAEGAVAGDVSPGMAEGAPEAPAEWDEPSADWSAASEVDGPPAETAEFAALNPEDDSDADDPAVMTETMAELLYDQGHLDRAAEVYQELLVRQGGSETISRRLAEIEAEMRGETVPAGGEPDVSWDGRHGAPDVDTSVPPVWMEAVDAVAHGVSAGLDEDGAPSGAAPVATPDEPAAGAAQTVSQYLLSLLRWRPGAAQAPDEAAGAAPPAEPEPPAAEPPAADTPWVVADAPDELEVGDGAAPSVPEEAPATEAGEGAQAGSVEHALSATEEFALPDFEAAPETPAGPPAEGPPAAMPWDEQTLNAPEAQPPLDEPWIAPSAGEGALEVAPPDSFADSFAHGFDGAVQSEPTAEAVPGEGSAEPAAGPGDVPAEEMPWESSPAVPPVAESSPAMVDAEPMPWEAPAEAPAPAEAGEQGAGFSFEDFFAPGPAAEAAPPAPEPALPPEAPAPPPPPAPAEGAAEDEDLESFQAWLQSLKR